MWGLRLQDQERVQNLFKNNYNVPVDVKETSVRGWNWGKADVIGPDLAFTIGGKPAFTVPVGQVHNTTINKTEVILEFNQPDLGGNDKVKKKNLPDELVEMRVYIPGSESRARKKAKKAERMAEKKAVKAESGVKEESEEEEPDTDDVTSDEGEDQPDSETTAAQVFHDTIKDRADIGQISGESVMAFNEVHFQVPRCASAGLFPKDLPLLAHTCSYSPSLQTEGVTKWTCTTASCGCATSPTTTRSCSPASSGSSSCLRTTKSTSNWLCVPEVILEESAASESR